MPIHKEQGPLFALPLLLSSLVTKVAFAACPPNQLFNPFDADCSNNTTLVTVAGNFNAFLLAIAAPLCGIMVVWGGFQMMTAGGNPEKFSSGRKTLIYAAIGFVIVLLASGATQLIKSVFNGS